MRCVDHAAKGIIRSILQPIPTLSPRNPLEESTFVHVAVVVAVVHRWHDIALAPSRVLHQYPTNCIHFVQQFEETIKNIMMISVSSE
jgi:hypothetical protein